MDDLLNGVAAHLAVIASIIISLGIIGGAGVMFHRRVIVPIRDSVIALRELAEAQLRPNHGGSLLDRVVRTEETLNQHVVETRPLITQFVIEHPVFAPVK